MGQEFVSYPDTLTETIEFFYNSLFSAKSWQTPDSIEGEEQNKNLPKWGLNA